MLHAEFRTVALASIDASSKSPQPSLRKPVPRTSLAGSVYQSLLEAVLAGELKNGEELNEVALAEQMGVSRTPVHEALRRLTADGLVEALPNGKSKVASFTHQSIVHLYDMRMILEGSAAEKAASQISTERVNALKREADQLKQSIDDGDWPSRAIHFDLHFHDVVAEASGNEFLWKDIVRHRRLVQGFCRFTGTRNNLRAAFDEHCRILQALENGNGAEARQAMEAHIGARMRALLSQLEQREAPITATAAAGSEGALKPF